MISWTELKTQLNNMCCPLMIIVKLSKLWVWWLCMSSCYPRVSSREIPFSSLSFPSAFFSAALDESPYLLLLLHPKTSAQAFPFALLSWNNMYMVCNQGFWKELYIESREWDRNLLGKLWNSWEDHWTLCKNLASVASLSLPPVDMVVTDHDPSR